MPEILKDCKCIDSHDAGVIIMAIDHMRQNREDMIKELKRRGEPKGVADVQIDTYDDDIKELKNTRKRLTNTQIC